MSHDLKNFLKNRRIVWAPVRSGRFKTYHDRTVSRQLEARQGYVSCNVSLRRDAVWACCSSRRAGHFGRSCCTFSSSISGSSHCCASWLAPWLSLTGVSLFSFRFFDSIRYRFELSHSGLGVLCRSLLITKPISSFLDHPFVRYLHDYDDHDQSQAAMRGQLWRLNLYPFPITEQGAQIVADFSSSKHCTIGKLYLNLKELGPLGVQIVADMLKQSRTVEIFGFFGDNTLKP